MNALAEATEQQNYLSERAVSRPAFGLSASQALGSVGPGLLGEGFPWRVVYSARTVAAPRAWWHFAVSNRLLITSEPPEMVVHLDWLSPVITGLGSTLGLPRGWDTYDGAPVSGQSVQRALAFLFRFLEPTSPPPAVVPLSDGGVQVEWHRGGLDIEVTFSPREAPELYVRDLETGNEWDGDATPELIEQVRPLLARLRAAQ